MNIKLVIDCKYNWLQVCCLWLSDIVTVHGICHKNAIWCTKYKICTIWYKCVQGTPNCIVSIIFLNSIWYLNYFNNMYILFFYFRDCRHHCDRSCVRMQFPPSFHGRSQKLQSVEPGLHECQKEDYQWSFCQLQMTQALPRLSFPLH